MPERKREKTERMVSIPEKDLEELLESLESLSESFKTISAHLRKSLPFKNSDARDSYVS